MDAFPSGEGIGSNSPIVVIFDESMNPATIVGALEVVEFISGAAVPTVPTLAADGRMLILLPLGPLPAGQAFDVIVAEDRALTDLSGQIWNAAPGSLVASFTVEAEATDVPSVVATFPADGSTGLSDLASITVIFDRDMVIGDFDTASWVVKVNGTPSSEDPSPLPLLAPPANTPVSRIWSWSNAALGQPRVPLPTGAAVSLILSPSGALLHADDMAGVDLPETSISFDLAPFDSPVAITKPFEPIDALGGPDLAGMIPVLQVELSTPGLSGDTIELYLFGDEPGDTGLRRTVARSVAVPVGSQLVDVLPTDLSLLDASNNPILGEGAVRIAARMVRGTLGSSVRLADGDPAVPGAQDLLLDTTPPTLLGLGLSGTNLMPFVSDQRGLVLVGRADEMVSAARVSSAMGDNFSGAEIPSVALGAAAGTFVTQPVNLGLLDPTDPDLSFTVQIYDRALNATTAIVGSFRQVGAMGPGNALPATQITVRVLSEVDLTPVVGARVMVHERDGMGAIVELGVGFTGTEGRVVMPASMAGDTIVTVEQAGFDLFTFDRVPVDYLTTLMRPSNQAAVTTAGEVLAALPATIGLVSLDGAVGDSRAGIFDSRLVNTGICIPDLAAGLLRCPFGPLSVQPGKLGIRSFMAVDGGLSSVGWTAAEYLQAFSLSEILLPAQAGMDEIDLVHAVDQVLLALPAEEQAIALTAHVLTRALATGLGTLIADPLVTVEGLVPGLSNPLVVGRGEEFVLDASNWTVLGAIPGAADGIDDGGGDVLGSLVTDGTIEADLFLRAEVEDTNGNVLVARPRLSVSAGALVLPAVPTLLAPAAMATIPATGFDIGIVDVIPDAAMAAGLVHVQVVDSAGRRWDLWTVDSNDAAGPVRITAPDITTMSLGGTSLSVGAATARVEVFSWSSLNTSSFLWSDIGREAEIMAFTGETSVTIN
ncbi:MAG: hypothetical protein ACI8QC_003618 [Planctomycetota bacterium]|jgi:hypothetical protein